MCVELLTSHFCFALLFAFASLDRAVGRAFVVGKVDNVCEYTGTYMVLHT